MDLNKNELILPTYEIIFDKDLEFKPYHCTFIEKGTKAIALIGENNCVEFYSGRKWGSIELEELKQFAHCVKKSKLTAKEVHDNYVSNFNRSMY